MAQKSNTVNLVIRDANGHPQMIKVVNTPSTSVSSAPPMQLNSASVFKVPAVKNPNLKLHMYQTVKVTGAKGGSRLVQLPVETITKLKQAQVLPSTSSVKKAHSSPGVIMSAPSIPSSSRQSSIYSNPSPSSSSGSSHVSTHNTRKRHETDKVSSPAYTTKRRKCADKIGKGLRHFSMKVCEKVRAKGFTSYNEVADELVAEFAAGMHVSPEDQQYDQKNIRRRVYDALNVLMAMNIISKEKKEIRWLGLPTNNAQECNNLEKDKQLKLERIQQKTQHLHELILQHISFKSLVERNRTAEAKGFKPSPSSAIHLPFIVVNTSDKALIDCSISNDKTEYMFNFSEKFQIYDDIDILKRMGLLLGIDKGECTPENMAKAKAMVPKSLEHYLERLGTGQAFKASNLLEESDYEDDEDDDEENIDEEGCKVTTEYSDGTNSDIDVN